MSDVQLGIDQICGDPKLQARLRGQRVALLGHPASMTSQFQHSLDAVMLLPNIKVTCAFGPQHGMRGEKQDNMVETPDDLDQRYQIPIFSLYGEVRRPTAEMMDQFDILLIDLQDVGTRIYTFLTTLLYMLEACAEKRKQIFILDRPNPVGRQIEGTLLKKGFESFVGASTFPMRHGLTLGEAAKWFKKNHKIDVELTVVAMKNYFPQKGPGYGWPTELAWVNPSPNIPSLNSARVFPGGVLIEGTHLSEGRGTTRPFEYLGAPDIDGRAVLKKMEELASAWMRGCLLRPCYFQPTFQKHAGKICSGFQIHIDHPDYDHVAFRPYRLVCLFLKAIRMLYPDYSIWRDFHYEYEKDRLAIDLINGSSLLREWVDNSHLGVADFEVQLLSDEKQWTILREEFLIYP